MLRFILLIAFAIAESNMQYIGADYNPLLHPKVFCLDIPPLIFACLGRPRPVRVEVAIKCQPAETECIRMKCVFNESGWLDGNKVVRENVSASMEQFLKEYPEWPEAVENINKECLSPDLPVQGIDLDCPAFDVMHCMLTSIIRYAKPSRWSTLKECEYARAYAGACPVCPRDCIAKETPDNVCIACRTLPRKP